MSDVVVKRKGNTVMIANAVAFWPSVHKAVPKYKKPDEKEYKVELIIPEAVVDFIDEENINKQPKSVPDKNKARIKAAKKKGEDPKNMYPDDFKDDYILNLTSSDTWPSGDDKEIKVVFEGKPFKKPIGNGSVLSVICYVGKDNGDGHTLTLSEVKIETLVEAEEQDGFSFDMDSDSSAFDDFDDDASDSNDDFEDDDVPFD